MSGLGLNIIYDRNILYDSKKRTIIIAAGSFLINSVYSAVNIFLGITNKSYWFITLGTYYFILSVMRFYILLSEKRITSDKNINHGATKTIIGIMLIILGFVLCGSVYLSVYFEVTGRLHEILVITMATYAFSKITLAIINFVKRHKLNSPVLMLIRNIGLADAAVSIFSLQKTMLVSFEGMTDYEIKIMNACTGTVVWIFVVLIGIVTIRRKKNIK